MSDLQKLLFDRLVLPVAGLRWTGEIAPPTAPLVQLQLVLQHVCEIYIWTLLLSFFLLSFPPSLSPASFPLITYKRIGRSACFTPWVQTARLIKHLLCVTADLHTMSQIICSGLLTLTPRMLFTIKDQLQVHSVCDKQHLPLGPQCHTAATTHLLHTLIVKERLIVKEQTNIKHAGFHCPLQLPPVTLTGFRLKVDDKHQYGGPTLPKLKLINVYVFKSRQWFIFQKVHQLNECCS